MRRALTLAALCATIAARQDYPCREEAAPVYNTEARPPPPVRRRRPRQGAGRGRDVVCGGARAGARPRSPLSGVVPLPRRRDKV